MRTTVRVPSVDLYASDVEQELQAALNASEFVTESDEAKVMLNEPKAEHVYNRYVYGVHYRFRKYAPSRAEKQRDLF